jgi:hypothetical protein
MRQLWILLNDLKKVTNFLQKNMMDSILSKAMGLIIQRHILWRFKMFSRSVTHTLPRQSQMSPRRGDEKHDHFPSV